MMKRLILILFAFGSVALFAQENNLERIKKLCYEEYEYEKVIQLSNELIKNKDLDDSTRIDLYFMRGISLYVLEQESQARASFENILKIKKNYTPDVRKISPKIMVLFNEVKTEFIRQNPMNATTPEDVARIISLAAERQSLFKNASVKNLIVPGWGLYDMGSPTKGLVLSGFSTLNLAAMIYFIFDTNKKQDAYLKETNKQQVETKYSVYNTAYKTRNALIFSYAAMWLYTQIDLHFFNNSLPAIEQAHFSSPIEGESVVGIAFGFPLN